MTAKTTNTFLAGLFALAARSVFAADDVPKAFAIARYEPMINRSPFAVATAAAPPAATASFAKDLYVANAAHSAEGDFATLASLTDKNLKEYLSSKETNPHGFGISNFEWSDRIGATKVTVSKDGQFATLTFNEAILTQPIPNAGGAPQAVPPPPPGGIARPAVNLPMPVQRPGSLPAIPTPPPHVRGTIPRNPQPAPAQPQPEL
jgi:hypothetical protein